MTIDEAIRSVVADVLRSELPKVLDDVLERRRLIPIKHAPVAYRLLLSAEKAGELRIFRRGNSSFVEAEALDKWIMTAPPLVTVTNGEAEPDEIGELIEFQDRNRRTRKAGGAR